MAEKAAADSAINNVLEDAGLEDKPQSLHQAITEGFTNFNQESGTDNKWGSNWNPGEGEKFAKSYFNNLLPKVAKSVISIGNGVNSFDPYYRENENIGEFTEIYTFSDFVPPEIKDNAQAINIFTQNYPKIVSRYYDYGLYKQAKYSFKDTVTRQAHMTYGSVTAYMLGMRRAALKGYDVSEERECRAMLVDYALEMVQERRPVTSLDELANTIALAMLDIQANASYHEARLAAGGNVGRITERSKLELTYILTTTKVKTHILNSVVGNTFQIAGLDPTDRIMTFPDLGGVWKLTEDIVITDINTVNEFRNYMDHMCAIGDTYKKNKLFTFDVSKLTEFVGKVREIKPKSEYFTLVMNVNSMMFDRNTSGMDCPPVYAPENQTWTFYNNIYENKRLNIFKPKILISGPEDMARITEIA